MSRPKPPTEGPRTVSGRAMAGWIKPRLRGAWQRSLRDIEVEAARVELHALRDRVAALPPEQPATEALRLIDDALAALDEPPDRPASP